MERPTEPLVSIGIPSYNRADGNLLLSLECALNQSYKNIEVFVSDNCSSDSTAELMGKIDDPRFTYYRHDRNIGPNNNFNHCLEMAKGDYFLLLHDDDLIDTDFVEECMDAAKYSVDYGFIKTGTRIIDAQGLVLRDAPSVVESSGAESFYQAWFTGAASVYLCSTLFNTQALRENKGFHSVHNYFPDGMALARIWRQWPCLNVEASKASFRSHPGQLTHASGIDPWCEEFGEFLSYLVEGKQISSSCLESGIKFFRGLMLRRVWKMKRGLKRQFARFRVNRYFDRLDLS